MDTWESNDNSLRDNRVFRECKVLICYYDLPMVVIVALNF